MGGHEMLREHKGIKEAVCSCAGCVKIRMQGVCRKKQGLWVVGNSFSSTPVVISLEEPLLCVRGNTTAGVVLQGMRLGVGHGVNKAEMYLNSH